MIITYNKTINIAKLNEELLIKNIKVIRIESNFIEVDDWCDRNIVESIINSHDPILPTLTLDEYKHKKINELRTICGNKIQFEFYSDCEGEHANYPCEIHDQININSIKTNMSPEIDFVMWKKSSEIRCRRFDKNEFIRMYEHMCEHVEKKRMVMEQAIEMIINADSKSYIDAICNSIDWQRGVI